MKKDTTRSSQDPELRVLEGQGKARPEQNVKRLGVTDGQVIETLRPNRRARLDAKTYQPDVADLLDTGGEVVDTEADWGESAGKVPPIGWFVLAGIIVCGFAVWAMFSVYEAQPELTAVEQEKEDLAEMRAEDETQVKQTLEGMQDVTRGYLAAATVDEMLLHVRHPSRVEPLMRKYYQSHRIQPVKFIRFERIRSLGLDSHSFVSVVAVLHGGGTRALILQQLDEDRFAVDWESDVTYQPIEWDKYLADRSVEPMSMRVLIQRDNFFAYEFRNEQEFDCYRIKVNSSGKHIFGYARKGSAVSEALRRYAERNQLGAAGTGAQPVMLKLRFPENSHSRNSVWIDELVAPRWILVE